MRNEWRVVSRRLSGQGRRGAGRVHCMQCVAVLCRTPSAVPPRNVRERCRKKWRARLALTRCTIAPSVRLAASYAQLKNGTHSLRRCCLTAYPNVPRIAAQRALRRLSAQRHLRPHPHASRGVWRLAASVAVAECVPLQRVCLPRASAAASAGGGGRRPPHDAAIGCCGGCCRGRGCRASCRPGYPHLYLRPGAHDGPKTCAGAAGSEE